MATFSKYLSQLTTREYCIWAGIGTTVAILGNSVAQDIRSDYQTYQENRQKAKIHQQAWARQMPKEHVIHDVVGGSTSVGQTFVGNVIRKREGQLFSGLLDRKDIEECSCVYKHDQKQLEMMVIAGRNSCGYPNTVHGGLTAAIFDEAFGALCFNMVRQGLVQIPPFTANLTVDYKVKVPNQTPILFTVWLDKIEGRKIFIKGTLESEPAGIVYAKSSALFVVPKFAYGVSKTIDKAASYVSMSNHPDYVAGGEQVQPGVDDPTEIKANDIVEQMEVDGQIQPGKQVQYQ